MKRQKNNYENLDLSRWHILNYHEQLLVNGGTTGGSDSTESTSQTESAEDTTETESSSVAEESNAASETTSETTMAEETVTETTTETGTHGTASGSEDKTETEDGFYVSSHADVANAEPGDTITRSDGSTYTVNQGDINYERGYCDEHGIDWGKDEENKDSQTAKGDENATAKDTDALSDSQSGGNSEQAYTSKEDELGDGKSNGGDKAASGENKTASDKDAAANAGSKKENSEYLDYVERCRQRDEMIAAKKNSELNCPTVSKNHENATATNIVVGLSEILMGTVCFVGATYAASSIEISTGGIGSYYAGMAIVEGYAAGATLVAFGVSHLSGACDSDFVDDITTAFVPAEVDMSKSLYDYNK